MPEIPTYSLYTTTVDESAEISEDLYSSLIETVRRARRERDRARGERGMPLEQSMQESYLAVVNCRRAQQRERARMAEFYQTLDATTARYMRDYLVREIELKRPSSLKVLAKKEKEINATKME